MQRFNQSPEVPPPADRRQRILDAAERCIVRSGFHRTTMQDVAAEAGMSPGNLYRYFRSKDAMVAGLAERDRAQMGQDFQAFEGSVDFLATFHRIARKHFEEEPREKSILCLEIWADATRNPTMAALNADFERDVMGNLTALFGAAQERGDIPAHVDVAAAARVILMLANGLFVRRAVSASFDAARETAHVLSVIDALLSGSVPLADPAVRREPGPAPTSRSSQAKSEPCP
jgi:TetR/AcrR family transcriptional regulator, repressor for uid operon